MSVVFVYILRDHDEVGDGLPTLATLNPDLLIRMVDRWRRPYRVSPYTTQERYEANQEEWIADVKKNVAVNLILPLSDLKDGKSLCSGGGYGGVSLHVVELVEEDGIANPLVPNEVGTKEHGT